MSWFAALLEVAADLEDGENTDTTLTNAEGEKASFTVSKSAKQLDFSPRPYDKNAQKLIDSLED
jgi:hypothetical protein